METFKVLFPTNWDGCELKLMKLNTEKDNPSFRNNEVVVVAMLPENKIKLYLKDGDLVCLKRENIGDFEFHIFIYNEVIRDNKFYYRFTPTSKFLNQQPFEVETIKEANIAAKVICTIHDFSNNITFGILDTKN